MIKVFMFFDKDYSGNRTVDPYDDLYTIFKFPISFYSGGNYPEAKEKLVFMLPKLKFKDKKKGLINVLDLKDEISRVLDLDISNKIEKMSLLKETDIYTRYFLFDEYVDDWLNSVYSRTVFHIIGDEYKNTFQMIYAPKFLNRIDLDELILDKVLEYYF